MKRSTEERRFDALERVRASKFENSRAARRGSYSREEWQRRKDAEIRHLEEMCGIRKTTGN